MELLLHNYVSKCELSSVYGKFNNKTLIEKFFDTITITRDGRLRLYQRLILQAYLQDLIKQNKIYTIQGKLDLERIQNEYRKFIKENRYGRVTIRNGQVSIPRIQCSKSNGNNIKYDSRRFLNDMGK